MKFARELLSILTHARAGEFQAIDIFGHVILKFTNRSFDIVGRNISIYRIAVQRLHKIASRSCVRLGGTAQRRPSDLCSRFVALKNALVRILILIKLLFSSPVGASWYVDMCQMKCI